MLTHRACPRCGAPNLDTEIVCFACGAGLRPGPRRLRIRPARASWALWLALAAGLGVAALVAWQGAEALAAYWMRRGLPVWHLPAAGGGLVVAGQVAFWLARRLERRWWYLRRAPQLPLPQARVGDVVWLRGETRCETPLIPPYTAGLPLSQGEDGRPLGCVYYRYVRQEREEGKSGWATTERGGNAVDFVVAAEGDSVWVPSGGVLFDAPVYHEGLLDPSGMVRVKVWALPVGLPISACGLLAGETRQPRLDAAGPELPVVATWREPAAYVAHLARQARWHGVAAWALTLAGGLALVAGIAQTTE